jgi:hypothetical protein
LLTSLYTIATGESAQADIGIYEQIPFNTKLGCDHLIRNAVLQMNNQTAPLRVDVAVNFEASKTDDDSREQTATIIDIGDLRTFTALEQEVDAYGAALDATRMILDRPFPASEVPLLIKHS